MPSTHPSVRRLSVTLATVLVACSAPAFADEPEVANAPAASPATHHLFTTWFAGKAKADLVTLEAETAGATKANPSFATRAATLVGDALGLIGINYRLGGDSPSSGFDCSGMVRYVYQNAVGLTLPRRAEEISRVGVKVALSELQPGDLVFYKTLRATFSHVGIYLGNNRFIHAPSAGGAVRVDDMTQSYWATRFTGARRVDG